MTIPGSANPLLNISAAGAGGYEIERSLRFNSADSAYLNRTPSVTGNRKTWTWAGWVKRSGLGQNTLFHGRGSAGNNNPHTELWFTSGNTIQVNHFDTTTRNVTWAPVYRDVSAWYHVTVAIDTTQAVASNRATLYVNGSLVSSPSLYLWDQNFDTAVNATGPHVLGTWNHTSPQLFFNGYLADIHFIDGQALDPTSFGEFDTNGVWQPIDASGLTYGTNGFHLPFSDNSTAAALGTDTSGNSNTWTVNNISVTAGAGNDSLVDSPTNYGTDTGAGGEVRGNYATLNPLNSYSAGLSNGNLQLAQTLNTWVQGNSTIGISSGKWYWEVTWSSGTNIINGITKSPLSASYVGSTSDSWGYSGGFLYNNGSSSSYGASLSVGDVIGVALDLDAGTLVFYKNGTSQGQAASGLSGTFFPAISVYGTTSENVNFGQRPFAYTAPSGFKALCTTNLPEGTITTSGTFTGNALADGPFVYLNGVPTAMTINGNAVTFATHADKLSNGFKVRTSSASYNTAGSNTYSISTTGAKFKYARAQANP